jgi:hypothetical protein
MTHHIDGMVVVASGTTAVVARWSGVLRKAMIEFAVTHSLDEEGVGQPGHLEIWVEDDETDTARSALIESDGPREFLW